MISNDQGGEEHGIGECKLAMQQAKSNASEVARENTKLKGLLKAEQQKISELPNKLNTEVLVRKKTEMAYDAKVQVVDTKDQVIKYQKMSIDYLNTTLVALKSLSSEPTATYETSSTVRSSPDTAQETSQRTFNDINGAIVNGLLVSVDIQRMTTPLKTFGRHRPYLTTQPRKSQKQKKNYGKSVGKHS